MKGHSPQFLTWLIEGEGFILLILLCLSSFIGYQQWQQSQQINQLVNQLAPESQTSPQAADTHISRQLIWIRGSAFLIILCSGRFIGYQQWQQTQKINQFVQKYLATKL